MKFWKIWTLFLMTIVLSNAASGESAVFSWRELPPLPEAISGHSAGVSGNALIVAGGSSFPVSPWQGGTKEWKHAVYVLEPDAAAWVRVGELPGPRAYAASVSDGDSLWVFGGTDGKTVYDDVLRLRWRNGTLLMEQLTLRLPQPCAYAGATLLDGIAYIAGGQAAVDASQALDVFWSLDLRTPLATWQTLPSWDGPGRILPVLVAQDGAVHLFSGCALFTQIGTGLAREYLQDGHCYVPGKGWRTLPELPRPAAAAPAAALGHAHIAVIGGDDGSLFAHNAELGDAHPGFPGRVLLYHTITDTWTERGLAPEGYVTTQALVWRGELVIPGGEDRPGHRGNRVLAGTLVTEKEMLGWVDWATMAGYLCLVVAIGAYFSRREKSTEIFFLGGRRVPWWAAGLSIFGTALSAITYLSIPARAYAADWGFLLTNAGIVIVAPFVVHYYIPAFRRAPITTAYEYLEHRFNLAVRIYGSLCFMAFQLGRIGIVLLLPALALSAATGMNVYLCILLMGVLATLYTVLGGIEAVIWTDAIQSFVLSFGAFLAFSLILAHIEGGPGAFFHTAYDAGKFHTFNWRLDFTATTVWVVLIGNVFSSLYPYTADQTTVQRYLSTAGQREAARAVWTNALLTIPITFLFFGLGTALWVFFRQHPELLDPRLKNDAILPLFVVRQFPVGLKGMLIAGIFAAAMSTLDSSINSVSSVIIRDYYVRFRKQVSERRELAAARLLTLLLGLVGSFAAAYAARLQAVSLWEPFLGLLNLVGGGLAGVFALGVFTRRANGAGALVGASASACAVLLALQTPLNYLLHGMVGFLTAFLVGYAASVCFPIKGAGRVSR